MEKDENNLEQLKQDYQIFKEKYNLPEFDELNKDFSIEKVAETETELLLKEIRKYISDKLYNYLRFIENILNPVNVPMFIFAMVKSLNVNEKNKFTEIYKKLAKVEFDLFEIDIDYSEEKEANFIKNSYAIWKSLKKDLLELSDFIKKNWDHKTEFNGNNYLG